MLRAAFERNDEAKRVNDLRRCSELTLSLVASLDGDVVGYIAVERIVIGRQMRASESWALAPVAVMPRFQNQGIGGALIEEGLAGAKSAGVDFVLVLGEPRYYERFGFRASLAAAVEVTWAGPHLMGSK